MKQVWALIPLKDLGSAKTRLADALGTDTRRALVLAMAWDVAAALMAARTVTQVIFVSDIPDLGRLIGIDGVGYFNTLLAQGLNKDLETAAEWAEAQGATDVLIAHADLPRLNPNAIDQFILGAGSATERKIRAAACKDGTGTNLLFSSLPLPLPLVFGNNSLARFRQAAAEAEIAIDVQRDSFLEADIDEIEDLKDLAASCARGELAGGATAAVMLLAAPGIKQMDKVVGQNAFLGNISPESNCCIAASPGISHVPALNSLSFP